MRGLSAPVYGVVQELTTQLLSQCRCALGAQLAQQQQQQQLPWTSSSSSPQQLQQQRGKHTVRVILLKVSPPSTVHHRLGGLNQGTAAAALPDAAR